jgi:hypothetical protein
MEHQLSGQGGKGLVAIIEYESAIRQPRIGGNASADREQLTPVFRFFSASRARFSGCVYFTYKMCINYTSVFARELAFIR